MKVLHIQGLLKNILHIQGCIKKVLHIQVLFKALLILRNTQESLPYSRAFH